MARPIDTGALFDLLFADPVLMGTPAVVDPPAAAVPGLIGTYTFKAGGTAPALTRLWPNEKEDQGTRCQGVEVAIGRVPVGNAEAYFTGEVGENRIIRIYVTQWTVAPGGTLQLDAVVTRILRLLEGNASSTPAGLPDGLTGLGQVVIRYEAPEIVYQQLP